EGCKPKAKQTTDEAKSEGIEQENPYKDADIRAVIIPSEDNTFGYDIYLYDDILIHQPSRPGFSGNAGFATEEDAMKVAELVIKKIRNNEMPPTVTIEELQELKIMKSEL
ncbi:MAG: DUF4907 domain-containing protein, partial [Bacteroidales bacterium]|nr:DUF4907 domain-containing protein [Bacteroidales bacterium]